MKDTPPTSKRLDVIYENGVFRPLGSVTVREQQRGMVMLSEPEEALLDTEYMDRCTAEVEEPISLETVRHLLARIPESLAEDICAERNAR